MNWGILKLVSFNSAPITVSGFFLHKGGNFLLQAKRNIYIHQGLEVNEMTSCLLANCSAD